MEDRISLEVKGVWVRKGLWPKRTIIVKDASLKVEPGELVAIIGPNGAGKTTLLKAIGGEEPYQGKVLLNGHHLYDAPEFWLSEIGYVRSENVLHDDLRVREALKCVGQLRLPQVPMKQLEERIDKLLDEFDFPKNRRSARIKRPNLSDGQRKRLNICAELLTEPPLLLLDEPTSGIDMPEVPNLMRKLRERAEKRQQAILAVVHTLDGLDQCHRIVFVAQGGIITWRGSFEEMHARAQDILRGTSGITLGTAIFEALEKHMPDEAEKPVEDDLSKQQPQTDQRHKRSVPAWHQCRILLGRYWFVMCGNPLYLALNFLIGALGGLLLFVLQSNAFIRNLEESYSTDIGYARNAIFFVAFEVVLIALLGSFREIVKESRIYYHERLKGLSPWAYLLSKWVLLSGLVGILAPVLLMTVLVFVHKQGLPSEGVLLAARPSWMAWASKLIPVPMRSLALTLQPEGLLTLVLTCVATLTLGLVISALSNNQNTVTGLSLLVVIVQLVMSGLIQNVNLKDLVDKFSVFVTSRWAIEGFSTNLGLYCWANPQFKDFFGLGHLFAVWLFLSVYTLVALAVTYIALRLKEPFYSKRKALWNGLSNKGFLVILLVVMCLGSWGRFFNAHAQEYFELRTDRDVRIEDVASKNLYQTFIGNLSQSQCPTPVPLPSPPPPVVIEAATREKEATPSKVVDAHMPTPEPTSTETIPTNASASKTAPSGEDTPKPEPTPTATLSEPSPTATFSPTPRALHSLPEGQIQAKTQLQYGPEHVEHPIASVPKGISFILLGKDSSEGWYRVKLQGQNLVGWVRADMTDLQSRLANVVAAPPKCAKPRISLQGKQGSSLATWKSDVDGAVAAVVDLYREQAGEQFPRVELQLKVNGNMVKSAPIPATRQSFLLRGATMDAKVRAGDSLEFFLKGIPAGQEVPRFFVTIFFVPDRCNFGSE